jgi:hypothetical protein
VPLKGRTLLAQSTERVLTAGAVMSKLKTQKRIVQHFPSPTLHKHIPTHVVKLFQMTMLTNHTYKSNFIFKEHVLLV